MDRFAIILKIWSERVEMLLPFPLKPDRFGSPEGKRQDGTNQPQELNQDSPTGTWFCSHLYGYKIHVAMESHCFKEEVEHNFYYFEGLVVLKSVLEISLFVTTFYFGSLWSCYAEISNELQCFIWHNEIVIIAFCPGIPIEWTAALQSSLVITPFHWHLPF